MNKSSTQIQISPDKLDLKNNQASEKIIEKSTWDLYTEEDIRDEEIESISNDCIESILATTIKNDDNQIIINTMTIVSTIALEKFNDSLSHLTNLRYFQKISDKEDSKRFTENRKKVDKIKEKISERVKNIIEEVPDIIINIINDNKEEDKDKKFKDLEESFQKSTKEHMDKVKDLEEKFKKLQEEFKRFNLESKKSLSSEKVSLVKSEKMTSMVLNNIKIQNDTPHTFQKPKIDYKFIIPFLEEDEIFTVFADMKEYSPTESICLSVEKSKILTINVIKNLVEKLFNSQKEVDDYFWDRFNKKVHAEYKFKMMKK